MKTITLKQIPDDIHQSLKDRAKRNGRSLNMEILASLKQSVEVTKLETPNLLAEIDRVRSSDGARLNQELLERALTEGRP